MRAREARVPGARQRRLDGAGVQPFQCVDDDHHHEYAVDSELYRQRAQLIEPIFGNTKYNRGFTRFHRRGRSAARTEWRLMATTHNLCKLHQHFTAEED